jgi:pentatricopeptide repeat protein
MYEGRIVTATLADIYLQQGHIEKAVEVYEALLKKDPGNAFFRQRLSSIRNEVLAKQKVPAYKRILNKRLW